MSDYEADHEALALANELRPFVDGFEIDHPADGRRTLTMIEMSALNYASRYEIEQKRQGGACCCDRGPWDSGKCSHGPGKCELFKLAENILWRDEHVKPDADYGTRHNARQAGTDPASC